MTPPKPNLLSRLQAFGCRTIGVGKVGDIFADRNFDENYKDKSNEACLRRLESILDRVRHDERNFIFVNLVETDMIYGHRRDVEGYFAAVTEIDAYLPRILTRLSASDCLILTADHGCDPTYIGTDHTREYVPFLVYTAESQACSLGVRGGHDEVAARVYDHFGLEA